MAVAALNGQTAVRATRAVVCLAAAVGFWHAVGRWLQLETWVLAVIPSALVGAGIGGVFPRLTAHGPATYIVIAIAAAIAFVAGDHWVFQMRYHRMLLASQKNDLGAETSFLAMVAKIQGQNPAAKPNSRIANTPNIHGPPPEVKGISETLHKPNEISTVFDKKKGVSSYTENIYVDRIKSHPWRYLLGLSISAWAALQTFGQTARRHKVINETSSCDNSGELGLENRGDSR